MRRTLFVVAFAGACIEPRYIPCGDVVCIADLQTCTAEGCVEAGRAAACDGLPDAAACAYDGATGMCRGGACATQVCGDGVIDAPEECEGEDLAGATCLTYGFYEPAGLACAGCRVDTSACAGTCGDAIVNGPELCDGASGDVLTCSEIGFDYGSVTCSDALCAPLYTGCVTIGFRLRVHNDEPLGTFSPAPDSIYLYSEYSYTHISGGATQSTSIPQECGFPRAFWADTTDTVYIAGTEGLCRRSNGAWTRTELGSVRDVWAASPTELYAATESELLVFDGAAWTPIDIGMATPYNLRTLTGRGSTLAATRADGSVAVRSNGAWTIETVAAGQTLSRPWIAPGGDIYVGGDADIFQRTLSGWRTLPRPSSTLSSPRVGGVGDRAVFAASGRSGWVFDGTRWMAIELPPMMYGVRSVTGSDRHIVFGMRYELLTSSGYAWSNLDATIAAAESVWNLLLVSDDDVLVFGSSQTIRVRAGVRTTYPIGFVSDAWNNGTEIFAVGSTQLHRITDAGPQTQSYPGAAFNAVAGEAPDRVFAGGQSFGGGGTIVMWNGSAWSEVFPTASTIVAMWGSETRGVYAASGDRLYHHAPGAAPTAWTEETLPDVGALAIWGDDTQLVMTMSSRRIYRRAFASTTWDQLPHHLQSRVTELSGTAGDVFGVGDDRQLVHWDGTTWDQVRMPAHLTELRSVASTPNLTLLGGNEGVVRLFRPR